MPQSVIFRTLVAMVLLAPLPFGAVPAWAWSALACGVGVLLFGWGLLTVTGRLAVALPPLRLWWAAVPFGLAMGWAVFQTLPFSPPSLHHPLWRNAAETLGTAYAGAISLDPVASRESVVRIATYAGIFWLALQLGRDPERARRMLLAVAMGCAGYALYGLGVQFSGANTILWFDKTAYHDVVTASFVNRNSFATFAGLGLLCTAALLREELSRTGSGASDAKERLRHLMSERPVRKGALIGGGLALAVALLLSESRAGVAASGLALLVFFSILAVRRSASIRSVLGVASVLALAVAALLALSGEGIERRLWSAESDWQARSEIGERTREAIRNAPILGTGLGTFESVYRVYRSGQIGPRVDRAHNDYLELALELGVPAAACLIGTLVAVALACVIGVFVRRRDAGLSAVGFSACVLVGTHALVDFSLQIPAVAATFALVLGAATAQSWRRSSRRGRTAPTDLDTPLEIAGGRSGRHRGDSGIAHILRDDRSS